jgi:hypothetical protein
VNNDDAIVVIMTCLQMLGQDFFKKRFNAMMEVVHSSEISVYFYETTGCNIPEDSHIHTRFSEKLKYQP